VKEALGPKLERWASDRGLTTLNLMVDAKTGETVDALMGGNAPLPSTKLWEASVFSRYVRDSPVLFDLRALQELPEVNDWNRKLK